MIEVRLDELDTARETLTKINCALGGIDLATAIDPVPAALRDAATVPASIETAMRLAAAVQVYAERIAGLASAVGQSAAGYRAADEETAARFTALLRR